MSHHPDVLAQGVYEISFHTLHMVDIILVLEIRAIDLGKQLQELGRLVLWEGAQDVVFEQMEGDEA